LKIDKPGLDTVIRPPPKGVIHNLSFNLHRQAAQNYNIVEDLSQAPSMMSSLEVLQIFPAQQKTLLSSIGGFELNDLSMIAFDLETHIPRLHHQLMFQIEVLVQDGAFFFTIIDEGASICVMSPNCWKYIGSPSINQSLNALKYFDGRGFKYQSYCKVKQSLLKLK
jgi:hypothetical protein